MTSSLPEPIFDAIQELLDAAGSDLDAQIEALCKAHPDHATGIRDWVRECREAEEASRAHARSELDPDPLTIPLLRAVPVVRGVKVLGPAALYRTIAKGGMGCVFRARHVRLDHDVAVKCMQPDLAERTDSAFDRFEREARVGARLSSENIVHVSDCGFAHGLHFIVMEWVDGEDLSGRVRRLGARDAEETATILIGMARGLADVHDQSILHRDIKPQNVLLSRAGVVKIADLGIASLAGEGLTRSHEYLGTLGYMAPEQWDPEVPIGPQADIYALGLTAFFLLQGQHAVNRPSDPAPRLADLRPDLPAGLTELIDRCTLHDPTARPADGRALLEELRALGIGSTDGRLDAGAVAIDATDAPAEVAALDIPALRADLESDADAAPTVVSKPRDPEPEPAAAPTRGPGVGIAVAIVAALALGLSLWSLLGSRDGSDPDPEKRAADGSGSVEDRKDLAATPEGSGARKEAPRVDGPSSDRSSSDGRATDGNGGAAALADGSTPTTIPTVTPAIRRVTGEFAGGAPTLDEPEWTWGEALEFGARGVDFEIVADCADLRVEFGPPDAPAANLRRAAIEEIGVAEDGKRFRVRLDTEPARYSMSIVASSPGSDPARRQVMFEIPCTLPPVEGLDRVAPGDRVEGTEIDASHYATAGEGVRLRFVLLPAEDPAAARVMIGMTELDWGSYRAFLAKGGFKAFTAHVDGATRERFDKLVERTIDASLPATSLDVAEAHGFCCWLSAELGLDVQLVDTATWRRAALLNGGHMPESRGKNLRPFLNDDPVNYSPSDPVEMVNPEIAASNQAPGDAERWSVYRGKQGVLPLFHIAGNVAEVCIDDPDAAEVPTEGRILGGDYTDDTLRAICVPAPGEGRTWNQDRSPNDQFYGYRLVIRFSP